MAEGFVSLKDAVTLADTDKTRKIFIYNTNTKEETELQTGSLMGMILSKTLNYVSTASDVIDRFIPEDSELRTRASFSNSGLVSFASLFSYVLHSVSFNKVFDTIPGEPIVDLLKYQSLMFALQKEVTDLSPLFKLCHVAQIEVLFAREPEYNCFFCEGTDGILQAFPIRTISGDTYRIIRK